MNDPIQKPVNPITLSLFTPYFRHLISGFSLWLASGKIPLPPELITSLTDNPEFLQLTLGLGMFVVNLIWYHFSSSRRALLNEKGELKSFAQIQSEGNVKRLTLTFLVVLVVSLIFWWFFF